MATLELKCTSSSKSSFKKNARIKVTYTASNGKVTITELQGKRNDGYRSWNVSQKTITVKIGSSSKSVKLGHYIDFGASGKYKTWEMPDYSVSGFTGSSATITITMPSSGQAYTKAVFSGSIPISYTTYPVKYYANGGSNAPSEQTKKYGTALTLRTSKPTPPSGFSFYTWNTKSGGGGTNYAPGASYTSNSALNLYARYSKTIKLTYSGNGTTKGVPDAVSKTVYYSDTKASFTLAKKAPTREGYTFVGWSKSSSATSGYASGSTIELSSSDTLHAIWKKTITLNYNANGGTGGPGSDPKTIYNSTSSATFTISSTQPKKDNYTFVGWSTKKTDTSAEYKAGNSLKLSSGLTLYAIWKKTITLTYNKNDGNNTIWKTDKKTVYNSTTSATFTIDSATPTWTDSSKKFDTGWADSTTGAAKYTPGSTISLTSSKTIYAKWKNANCSIKYSSVSGTTNMPSNKTVVIGSKYTIPDNIPVHPEGDYYIFKGWTWNSGTYQPKQTITASGTSITLSAKWAPRGKGTITYNVDGGKLQSDFPSQEKLNDIAITLHAKNAYKDPIIEEGKETTYTFAGWSTKRKGPVEYLPGARYTKNGSVTLYAIYVENEDVTTYALVYDTENGTKVRSQRKYHDEDLYLTYETPTWKGHKFKQWNTQPDATGQEYEPGSVYTQNENLILHAIWTPFSHTVKFNANGGEGTLPDSFIANADDIITVPKCSLTKKGYVFYGWNSLVDGTGHYYFEDNIYNYVQDGGSITLYAMWLPMDILFYANGGFRAANFEEGIDHFTLTAEGVVNSLEFVESDEENGLDATKITIRELREGEELWRNY